MRKALVKNNMVVDVVDKEFEVHPSLKWFDCPDDCVAYRWSLKDGVLTPPVIDPPTYDELRRREYASLQEQADMQYWDSINGTTVWQDHIKDIKAKYPKG